MFTHARIGDDDWLLIKVDAAADARRNSISSEPASVVSDRTIDDVDEHDGEAP